MRLIKFLFSVCLVSLFALYISACSENQPEYDNTIGTTDTTISPALAFPKAVAETSGIANKASAGIIKFDTAKSVKVNPMITVPAQTISAKSTGAVNPAHGKPGHRCEIAVGAPLNSPPQAPEQQLNSTTPAPALVQSSPAKLPRPAAKSGRINPAHGQPGHSCAIPVGQPLK